MSFRLGRASSIQDFDITLPPLDAWFELESNDIWATYMGTWVHMANIQGRIYEQLFSPSALALSAEQRKQRGVGLAREMKDLKDKYAQVSLNPTERYM